MQKASKRVKENFLSVMKSLDLPKEHFSVLLGFSGGGDSSALFSLLHEHQNVFGYTLNAVHVNHMIRGDEAERDERFCEGVCKKYGVPYYLHKADVPAIAKERKRSLEEAARDVRYAAYADISKEITSETGLPVLIATAHNADDNAETVLFNLTRGSALSGLCGISTRRGNIIRPLILSTKSDIIGYCAENGIEYITDSTNLDTLYTRNKLRHLVIPTLQEINPSLSRTIARTVTALSADDDYLNSVSDEFIKNCVVDDKIMLSALNKLHPAIKSRVIYTYLNSHGVKNCSETHISSVIKLCENAIPHSKANLPCVVTALIENGCLCLESTLKAPQTNAKGYMLPFEYGINYIEQSGAIMARFDSDDKENIAKFKNIYKKFIQTHITYDKIKGDLRLRSRRPGDVYNIKGVNRKLKKLLWEIESDPSQRDSLALVCDEVGLLWVPGAHSRTGTYPTNNERSQTMFYVKAENTEPKG